MTLLVKGDAYENLSFVTKMVTPEKAPRLGQVRALRKGHLVLSNDQLGKTWFEYLLWEILIKLD